MTKEPSTILPWYIKVSMFVGTANIRNYPLSYGSETVWNSPTFSSKNTKENSTFNP